MNSPDRDTIRALRQDLALQIGRWIQRRGRNQTDMARQLDVPQPTLSKILRGRVDDLSLELLIRIAVRAQLPLTLQTGGNPAEAGVYVSSTDSHSRPQHSSVANDARDEMLASARNLAPEQRLNAHLEHCQLITTLYRAGREVRASQTIRRSRSPV